MADFFERAYMEHGNKVVSVPCDYVGMRSKCSFSLSKDEDWNSYICGCNSGGDCDACDD